MFSKLMKTTCEFELFIVAFPKTKRETHAEDERKREREEEKAVPKTHVLDNSLASSSSSFAANALKLLL